MIRYRDYSEVDIERIRRFLRLIVAFQSYSNYHAMDRMRIVEAWRDLPDDFRSYIATPNVARLERSSDGIAVKEKPVLSFKRGSAGTFFGSRVFSGKFLETHLGTIDTVRLAALVTRLTRSGLYDEVDRRGDAIPFEIHDNEDEVLVLLPQWKGVVVDSQGGKWKRQARQYVQGTNEEYAMSSMRALFEKYEYRGSISVPDAKHVAVANKREADRDADRKRREADPSDPRNKRIAAIEANQTEWTKLEGIDVLAVPDPKSLLVAVPTSGKKSSKTFEVMPRNPPRSVLAVLDKAEVNGWLVKAFVDGNEEALIRNAG
jgi:hypothetical protein